jgi:hypothetical protein
MSSAQAAHSFPAIRTDPGPQGQAFRPRKAVPSSKGSTAPSGCFCCNRDELRPAPAIQRLVTGPPYNLPVFGTTALSGNGPLHMWSSIFWIRSSLHTRLPQSLHVTVTDCSRPTDDHWSRKVTPLLARTLGSRNPTSVHSTSAAHVFHMSLRVSTHPPTSVQPAAKPLTRRPVRPHLPVDSTSAARPRRSPLLGASLLR